MKFKATLWILAILVTFAICCSSCRTVKKDKKVEKSEISSKSTVKESSESKEQTEIKEVTVSHSTDSGTVKTTIKPKGTFTFSNGVFQGEAESIDISHSYKGTKKEKKESEQSITKDTNANREAKNSLKAKVVKKDSKREVQVVSGLKVAGLAFLALIFGVAIWYIRKQVSAKEAIIGNIG